MKTNSLLRIFSAAALAAALSFVVLTFIAMYTYPGGTQFDKETIGYTFGANFFSDLGRTATFKGVPQTLTSVLFSLALGFIGIAIVPFFALMPCMYAPAGRARIIARIGAASGIIAGISYVGIALTPWDLYLFWHMKFVHSAFIFISIAMISCTASFIMHGGFSRKYPVFTGIFSIMSVSYVFLLFYGPSLETPAGLAVQVAAQKIIVYAAVVTIAIAVQGVRSVIPKES